MPTRRLLAFDWLRGLVVLLMVHAHTGFLLQPEVQAQKLWRWCNFTHGLVFPTFLFVAGFFFALRASREPLGVAFKRQLRLLGIAVLLNGVWFRFATHLRWVLRLDVLGCIALSLLLLLPAVYGLARMPRLRVVALGLLALGCFGLGPWSANVDGFWAFLFSTRSGSLFPLLPWAGHAAVGAAAGAFLAARGGLGDADNLDVTLLATAAFGTLVWVAGPALAQLYGPHEYWRTGPGPHGERWALVAWLAHGLCVWDRRGVAPRGLEKFFAWLGAKSLWLYAIHLTLLTLRFGEFSVASRWPGSLSFSEGFGIALGLLVTSVLLTALMDQVMRRWRPPRFGAPRAATLNSG
ncbi:MAG: heparan-alpha-glucosaminide N-acetyltransferase domain-containing protein [Myxococcaceae bacterium]